MPKSIQTVFGSKTVIANLHRTTPNPAFVLRPASIGAAYMLLDLSGAGHFAAPIQMDVQSSFGVMKPSEYAHFMYFHITQDDEPVFLDGIRKIFDNQHIFVGLNSLTIARVKGHTLEFVLISSWTESTDFFVLKGTPAFGPLRKFTTRAATSGGFHEAGYKVLDAYEFLD